MRLTNVGIEITPDELRVAVVEGRKNPVIASLAVLRDDAVGSLDENLKRYVRDRGFTGARVTFSVPSDQALFHWLRLPRASQDELEAVAQYRLREVVSRPTENMAFAVVPFEAVGEDHLDCLVVGAPQSLVESRALLLENVGLTPHACEVEAQSLMRVAQRSFAGASSLFRQLSMTVVDFGRDRTRFIVVQNRRIQFVRSVKFGSSRLVNELAQALGISEVDAQVVFDQQSARICPDLTLALQFGGETKIVDVSGPMESLFKELRRLITYFRTLRADRSYRGLMERMVLSGEMVSIDGFSEVIGKTIGISIHELNPFTGATLALPASDLAHAVQTPHRFTIALGHALADYPALYERNKQEETPNGLSHAA